MQGLHSIRVWPFVSAIFCSVLLLSGCTGLEKSLSDTDSESTTSAHSAGDFPLEPILRLETGRHTAAISRIDVDRDQRFVVTGSDDKTVRIWDLKTGHLLRTLRVPIGDGNLGKIYCVAISPDGNSVAASGWTGAKSGLNCDIYIFDRESGRIRHVINGLPNTIKHLTYSRDGKYLAATLGGRVGGAYGIRIYETYNYKQFAEDNDYSDSSYWADFDTSGRLVTTSWDGLIRLYDKNFRLIEKMRGYGFERMDPFSAAFSPDGQNIAVGYYPKPPVDVLSAENLELRFSANKRHTGGGDFSSVAWSADGHYLYAAGMYKVFGKHPIRRWSESGQGSFVDFWVSKTTIMDLKPLLNDRLVFAAQDPLIAVLSADGTPIWEQGADIADFKWNRGLRVSESGEVVQFSYKAANLRTARFSLTSWQLELNPPEDSMLSKPITKAPGLRITSLTGDSFYLNDKLIPLYKWETSGSLAIAQDHKHFLIGAQFSLRKFDQTGKQIWQVDTPASTRAVNICGDGQRAIAAYGDGTIRWYRMSDGKELLAFFPHKDGKRWIIWTPEGFYNASEGGEELIGYHLNRGVDIVAEFVRVNQVREKFYRPDLVYKSFAGGFDKEIHAELNRIGSVDEIIASGMPPKITLLSEKKEIRTNSRDIKLKFKVKDQGGGIGKIEYRINGVLVKSTVATRSADLLLSRASGVIEMDATLDDGKNIVTATAYNKRGDFASQPAKAVIEVDDPMKDAPSLYVLAVGISDYRDVALKLSFAHSDADMMAKVLKQRGKGLFKEIHITSLLNDKATKNEIKKNFDGLSKAKPSDVFVWYLAGHGKAINGDYHFVPWEALYENEETLKAASLSSAEIGSLFQKIQARKTMLILDTCYAGLAASGDSSLIFANLSRGIGEKSAISRMMKFTGRTILAASTEHQKALEGHEGHGIFTYVLLHGLKGKADRPGKAQGIITIDELADYAREEVPNITMKKWKFEQIPMRNMHGDPFPISCKEGFDDPGCKK